MVSKRINVGRRGSATTRVINTVPTRNNSVPDQETTSNQRRGLGESAANVRTQQVPDALPAEAAAIPIGGNANGTPLAIPDPLADMIGFDAEPGERIPKISDAQLLNHPNPDHCIGMNARALLMAMCARMSYLDAGTAANNLKTAMGMTDLQFFTPTGLDFPICFMSWGSTLVVGIPGYRTVGEVRDKYKEAMKTAIVGLAPINPASVVGTSSLMWSSFNDPAGIIKSFIDTKIALGTLLFGESPDIYVVGHSRGGAIAQCIAARIEGSPTDPRYNNYKGAYSFGGPPVVYAGQWLRKEVAWCTNYINMRDPVPFILKEKVYFRGSLEALIPDGFKLSHVGRLPIMKEWRNVSKEYAEGHPRLGPWNSLEHFLLCVIGDHFMKTYLECLRGQFQSTDQGMELSQSFKDAYQLCLETL